MKPKERHDGNIFRVKTHVQARFTPWKNAGVYYKKRMSAIDEDVDSKRKRCLMGGLEDGSRGAFPNLCHYL